MMRNLMIMVIPIIMMGMLTIMIEVFDVAMMRAMLVAKL